MTDYKSAHNNKILSKSIQYNGRVNPLALTEDENARFMMFEKVAIKNKATDYRGAIKHELEESPLSKKFFSKENIQVIQDRLREGVYQMSKQEYVIAPQNVDVLKSIMRNTFLEYGEYRPNDIQGQVERLNILVLEYTVPKVYSEAVSYLKYLQDSSTLVTPLDLPKQTDRCYKSLMPSPWI